MQEAFSSNASLRELSPPVKNLLYRVYFTLLCALLAFAFGSYLHMLWNIGGIVTSFGFFGGVHLLRFTTPNEQSSKRLSLLFLSALLKGASVGPVIELVFEVDSSFVVTACVGTAVPFACFAAASMLTRRREYLYLGGVLSSLVSILWWLQFSSSIIRGSAASVFIFNLEVNELCLQYTAKGIENWLKKFLTCCTVCIKSYISSYTLHSSSSWVA
ncbi:Bax inhibitor-1 family protein [Hirschfeldia incana]|nr:Bax inhibitor-1 family protein [Hirschfeldia incana]